MSEHRSPVVWLRQLVRDPMITIANTVPAIIATVVLTWLGFGLAFAALEDVPVKDGLYWSVTTLSTTGYGDFSPKTDVGKAMAGVYMVWTLFFLLPAAIFHVAERLLRDKDEFDHAEQEQLKTDVQTVRAEVARLQAQLEEARVTLGAVAVSVGATLPEDRSPRS